VETEKQIKELALENLLLAVALIAAIAIIIGLLVAWPTKAGAQEVVKHHTMLHVEEVTNQGIVAVPIISPHFDLSNLLENVPAALKGSMLDCVVTNEMRSYSEHRELILVFSCKEPGKPDSVEYRYRLTGLAFDREGN
jgi:hypothetical protein